MDIRVFIRRHSVLLSTASFLVIALLIMGPLLLPGYILTLDMAWGPKVLVPSFDTPSWPFYGVLWLLQMVIPGDIMQKCVLIAIITLAGLGVYFLSKELFATSKESTWNYGAFIAGFFYIINPFVFTRFIVGQFAVLAGYALLPWVARASLRCLQNPSIKKATSASVWLTTLAIMSIHTLLIAAIVSALFATLTLWRHRKALRIYLNNVQLSLLWFLGSFLILNAYWILPIVLQTSNVAGIASSFTSIDRQAFATTSDSLLGLIGNVVALYGFWADNLSLYTLPKDEYIWWWLPLITLWLLVLYGIYVGWRRTKAVTMVLGLISMIGVVAALGYRGFEPLVRFINVILPVMSGYREPQKFSMLITLSFAIFIGLAVASMSRWLKKYKLYTLPLYFVVITVVSYTPSLWWGLGGQVKATAYPVSWYEVNRRLNEDAKTFNVLFLPWHQYLNYGFVGRTVAPLPPHFFDKPLIMSNQPEFANIQPTQHNHVTDALDKIVTQPKNRTNFAFKIARYNVKYIMLAKGTEDEAYAFLHQQPQLELIYQTKDIELYRNNIIQ